jgi:Zn-dependent protease
MMDIDFVTGFLWFVSFLFSTTVHEAMHALAAWRLGDPTAYNGGQVTLSPAPHVAREPVGMLLVPLVTSLTQGWAIGWASCPYDPLWAERYPRRAAVMAAAGPFGNFMIATGAFVLIRAGLAFGLFVAPETASLDSIVELASQGPSYITTMLSVLIVQNVFLGSFNLLPLPPLDGSAVLTGLLSERHAAAMRNFSTNGMMSMMGLLVAWQIFPMATDPLFSLVLRLLYPESSYY